MTTLNLKKSTDYILGNVDIVDYLSRFYGMSFKRYGGNMRALCPLHPDNDPSFSIKIGKQAYYCFGCKSGGSVITFVEQIDKLQRIPAIISILQNLGLDIQQFIDGTTQDYSGILNAAQQYFINQESQVYNEFFKNKGFKIDFIRSMGIGWSDSTKSLNEFLLMKGIDEKEIWKFGFNNQRYNGAITYPVYDSSGRISYFQCRTFDDVKYYSGDESIPTYIQDLLLGIHKLKSTGSVILVEGYNDWLALQTIGFNSLAMGGLKLNENMIRQLRMYDIYDIYIWVDGDAAGWKFLNDISLHYNDLFIKNKLNAYGIFVKGSDPDKLILSGFNIDNEIANASLLPIFHIENKYDQTTISSEKLYIIDDVIRMCNGYDHVLLDLIFQKVSNITGINIESIKDRYYSSDIDNNIDMKVESVVISCLLHDSKLIYTKKISDNLFATNSCQQIFKVIKENNANYINIKSMVPTWVYNFIDDLQAPDFVVLDECITILRELSNKRIIANTAKSLLKGNITIDSAVSNINELMMNIDNDGDMYSTVTIGESMKSTIDGIVNNEIKPGYSLGPLWPITNQTMLGICRKRLILVTANTGHHKTNLAMNWIYWLSFVGGYKGALFTGEMDPEEVTKRLIAIATGVSGTDLISNNVRSEDIDKIFKLITELDPECLHINETMDFTQIINTLRYMKFKHDIKYGVIDYAQLLEPPSYTKNMSRPSQLKEMTRRLKIDICKKLDMPIILLAQLSDQALDDTLPKARRMSESKMMESDADVSIAMRIKTEREIAIDPRGNVIFHIDKVRYNRRYVVIPVHFSDVNLTMKEC